MEEREILVANTKTQKRYKITTGAETLGELKDDLYRNSIDYAGMTFTEGITRSQLIDDSSQLPKNVNYRGNITNSLVILLTNTNKKIASGALGNSRADAYAVIKEQGLQNEIKDHFGRNFTQVSTSNLVDFIKGFGTDTDNSDEDDVNEDDEDIVNDDIDDNIKEEVNEDEKMQRKKKSPKLEAIEESINKLIDVFNENSSYICKVLGILNSLEELKSSSSEKLMDIGNNTITDEDLDDMMQGL